MLTRNIGIVLDQGADFSVIIGVVGDDGPVDLTGYTFKSQMRKTTAPVGGSPIAEFSFEILNQTTYKGRVRWYLGLSAIASITTSISNELRQCRLTTPFVFDVKMKDPAGIVKRPIQGLIYISPQATQETI